VNGRRLRVASGRSKLIAVLVAAVTASLAAAVPASAATAEIDANTLVIAGTPDNERTTVRVGSRVVGGVRETFWTVRNVPTDGGPAVEITPGDGCDQVTANEVSCPNAGSPNVRYDGGDGTNRFDIDVPPSLFTDPGTVTLYGGEGHDFFDVLRANGPAYAELGNGDDDFGTSGDYIHGVEVYAGAGRDDLDGSPIGGDILDGGADNDRIEGEGGADQIDLGTGNDVAQGDQGDDLIHGGPGDDALAGGADDDDLYGDEGEDGFGADHNYVLDFSPIVISGPTAQTQGDDELFLREPQPEQDFVYDGGFDPQGRGGCLGGTDYVQADSIDIVPLNVGCETIDRPGTPASLSLTPAAQEFGLIQVGSGSMVRAFTLTNSGDLTSGPLQALLGGTNADQFTISETNCPQAGLPGHYFCTIGIRFFPTSAGPKAATLNIGGESSQLTGTGQTGGGQTGGGQTGGGQTGGGQTGGGQTSGGQTGGAQTGGGQTGGGQTGGGAQTGGGDGVAPLIKDITKAVQRLAAALGGRFQASITTNEAGTWRIQVLQVPAGPSAARKRLLASRTVKIGGAGTWRAKVPFKASAKKGLRRLRVVRLQVRSTFTDAAGNKTTTTRKVTLRR
jgi:hypothetical protein